MFRFKNASSMLLVTSRRSALLLSSFFFLLPSACSQPEVPRETWEPITDEELKSALGAPTGKFVEAPDPEVLAEVESQLPGVVEAARFVGHMVTVIAQANDEDLQSREDELPSTEQAPESNDDIAWGTSLYLKVACPGPLYEPIAGFNYGEVRIDSPVLSGLDFSPLLQDGQFLLSFSECEMGPLTIDRRIAGRYFTDSSNLVTSSDLSASEQPKHVLALNPRIEREEGALGLVAFACGSLTEPCTDLIRVAVQIDTGAQGTYVVAFELAKSYFLNPGTLSLTIRGATSQSTCQATGGSSPSVTCSSN